MDEKPNVNNLNGVPNFGHGIPEGSSEEAVIAADPEAVFASSEVVDSPVESTETTAEAIEGNPVAEEQIITNES